MQSTENTKITSQTSHVRWFELVLVAAILIAVLGKDIQSVAFYGDESDWITTSYFAGPFFEGDFSSPVWREHYWTRVQPPVARYIIGIGRRIGGFRAKDLNAHWKWYLSRQANIERGAMPSANLLWWSRMPMAALAAVSGVLLFWLTRKAAGWAAGYAVIILFMMNPYLLTTLRRAMSESPLLVFILLAAFAGYQAMSSLRRAYAGDLSKNKRSSRPSVWFFLMGMFCGMAAGAKLNGISVLMAGLGLCVLNPSFRRNNRCEMHYAGLYACVLILAAGITFVGFNPFLYRNPVERTHLMFQQRFDEISGLQKAYPAASVDNNSRIQVIRQRVFERYATLRFSGGEVLNLLLCAAGLTYLVSIARERFENPIGSDAAIVILLIAVTSATPALFTPLDWDRYYLLPVVFSTTLIGVGIGCTLSGVTTRLLAR